MDDLDKQIDDYIVGLLEAKGVGTLAGESLEDAAAELKGMFINFLNMSVIDALPEDKVQLINQIPEGDPAEMRGKIDEIVAGANLDMPEVMADAITKFSALYMQEVDEAEEPEAEE
jgi:hypothetical protein